MTTETPAIGSPVLYTLNKDDAERINKRRDDFRKYTSGEIEEGREYPNHGWQAHVGNTVHAGQQFPGVVVNRFSTSVNLRVFLDGTDDFWACSKSEGAEEGNWQVQA